MSKGLSDTIQSLSQLGQDTAEPDRILNQIGKYKSIAERIIKKDQEMEQNLAKIKNSEDVLSDKSFEVLDNLEALVSVKSEIAKYKETAKSFDKVCKNAAEYKSHIRVLGNILDEKDKEAIRQIKKILFLQKTADTNVETKLGLFDKYSIYRKYCEVFGHEDEAKLIANDLNSIKKDALADILASAGSDIKSVENIDLDRSAESDAKLFIGIEKNYHGYQSVISRLLGEGDEPDKLKQLKSAIIKKKEDASAKIRKIKQETNSLTESFRESAQRAYRKTDAVNFIAEINNLEKRAQQLKGKNETLSLFSGNQKILELDSLIRSIQSEFEKEKDRAMHDAGYLKLLKRKYLASELDKYLNVLGLKLNNSRGGW
jgi:hypothetical protein